LPTFRPQLQAEALTKVAAPNDQNMW